MEGCNPKPLILLDQDIPIGLTRAPSPGIPEGYSGPLPWSRIAANRQCRGKMRGVQLIKPSAKKNPGETPLPLRQNRRRVLPFPTAQPKKVLSIVKQVVIGPRLRRAGVVVFDECAGFSSVRPQPTAPVITLVRDGSGLGFHWAACGCIRNYTACPVVVVPVAPVVVAPLHAPSVVVTLAVCPYGYYLGPYGRCLPY